MQVNATTPLSRIEVDLRRRRSHLAGRHRAALPPWPIGSASRMVSCGTLRVHSRAVRHEPGRVVRDLAVMLADGGDCLTDLGVLRDQGALRTGGLRRHRLPLRRAPRRRACSRASAPPAPRHEPVLGAGRRAPRRLILDIDATLVTAHSEKEGAAGTYKGGFGFHPLLCFEASTGEALAGVLRPGNAGANTASDHIAVLEAALAQLPTGTAGPRHPGALRLGRGHARLPRGGGRPRARLLGGLRPHRPRARGLPRRARERLAPGARQRGRRARGRLGRRACSRPADLAARAPAPSAAASAPTPGRSSPSPTPTAPLPGDAHEPAGEPHRAPRAGASPARRDRGRDPLAKASGLRNLPFRAYAMNAAWLELVLCRLRPPGLGPAASAAGHRSGHLRAQAPPLPPAARRREDRAARPRRAPAPAAPPGPGRRLWTAFRRLQALPSG